MTKNIIVKIASIINSQMTKYHVMFVMIMIDLYKEAEQKMSYNEDRFREKLLKKLDVQNELLKELVKVLSPTKPYYMQDKEEVNICSKEENTSLT